MYFIIILCILFINTNCYYDNEISLKCSGKTYKNVTLTAYYPDYNDQDGEKGYLDKRGYKLRTLQDYVDGRTDFVTLAMDKQLNIPYGTPVCIPELNNRFGHRIRLEIRDSSDTVLNMGFTRAEICVRTDVDSYDTYVNRDITLIFLEE